jgi:hypothetical protein
MQYTSEDRQEFAKQIQELLGANLIEPSESPHFSPAFLVNKHSEQKRGKRRMVINYKKLFLISSFMSWIDIFQQILWRGYLQRYY